MQYVKKLEEMLDGAVLVLWGESRFMIDAESSETWNRRGEE